MFVDRIPLKYIDEIQNNLPSLFLRTIITTEYLFFAASLTDALFFNCLGIWKQTQLKKKSKQTCEIPGNRIGTLVFHTLIFKYSTVLKKHII